MVKEGREYQRMMVVTLIVFTLFLAFQDFTESVEELRYTPPLSLAEHYLIRLVILSIPALASGILLTQGRHWKQVNYRRQMAASSWRYAAQVPLATVQRPPDAGALPLPLTIRLKAKWTQSLLVYLVLCVGAGFLSQLSIYLMVAGDLKGSLQYVLHGWPLLLSIEWSVITAQFAIWWFAPRQIEITSVGLTIALTFTIWPGYSWRPRRWQSTIRWNQVRLFAIRGKPGTPATYYELSSSSTVVQWKRVRHQRWWSLHRPAIPFAEYDTQMEALIALITGITGLPLYDVR